MAIVFHYLLFKRVLHINSHLLSSRLVTRAQNRSNREQTISLNLSALFGQTIKENGKMQMNGFIIMIDNTKLCRLCLSQSKDNGSTIPAEEMKSWLARLKVDVFSARWDYRFLVSIESFCSILRFSAGAYGIGARLCKLRRHLASV